MLSLYQDYEFQDKKRKKEYEAMMQNPIEAIKKRYKPSYQGVLSRIRKGFKVTPQAMIQNTTPKAKELREFALYMLTAYTNEDEKICSEFEINTQELEKIKNDTTLEIKYEKEIKAYFSIGLDQEILNLHQTSCFADSMSSFFKQDELQQKDI